MANPEHLQILKQGFKAWHAWQHQKVGMRPDLTEAHLSGADLGRVDLSTGVLRRANFSEANLSWANLSWTDLTGAIFTSANLGGAGLTKAYLAGADFSKAQLYEMVFGDTDLSAVVDLETCIYGGPSILDHGTLAKSWPLPLAFLRGCGLSDWEIEAAKLYQLGLTPTQIIAFMACAQIP